MRLTTTGRSPALTALAALTGTLVLALAACGGGGGGGSAASGGAAPAPPSAAAYAGPVGQGEGKLSVLAWPGYAEDGSTDPAVDWVTPFEQQTGCQVTVKSFATSA
jgi:putative spermidine/putrescine transport system substrate-binding protein